VLKVADHFRGHRDSVLMPIERKRLKQLLAIARTKDKT
jgi:hypothetical protein